MSKMNNLCLLLREIIEHGEAILEVAKEIRNVFSEETETLTLPEKAEKLSAIQPTDYETVLKEVEALSHE